MENFSWGPKYPPNAAIVLTDGSEEEDVMVIQITSPVYDNSTRTLSFIATPLTDYNGTGLAFYLGKADSKLPRSFGKVNLFIDDCPDHQGQCMGNACYGNVTYGLCFSPSTFHCNPCHAWNDNNYYENLCRQQLPSCCGDCYCRYSLQCYYNGGTMSPCYCGQEPGESFNPLDW